MSGAAGITVAEHRQAMAAIRQALRSGRLVRPDRCQDCGELAVVQAHHVDYSRPLDVRWLCLLCHRRSDRRRGYERYQAQIAERNRRWDEVLAAVVAGRLGVEEAALSMRTYAQDVRRRIGPFERRAAWRMEQKRELEPGS